MTALVQHVLATVAADVLVMGIGGVTARRFRAEDDRGLPQGDHRRGWQCRCTRCGSRSPPDMLQGVGPHRAATLIRKGEQLKCGEMR